MWRVFCDSDFSVHFACQSLQPLQIGGKKQRLISVFCSHGGDGTGCSVQHGSAGGDSARHISVDAALHGFGDST